jgi:IS30 family transposase
MNYAKRDAIINMYLKENMTADQISDETGYSLSTIKKVLSTNHASKHSINESKAHESMVKNSKKPYNKLTDDIVEYKGKKFRIMSKDELKDELLCSLKMD